MGQYLECGLLWGRRRGFVLRGDGLWGLWAESLLRDVVLEAVDALVYVWRDLLALNLRENLPDWLLQQKWWYLPLAQ